MAEQGPIVFCTGGGCTAKLGAGVLSRILEKLPRGEKDPNLLVGYDSRDDAAVYRVQRDAAGESFILTELRAAAGETLYYTDNTAPYFCAELVSVWKIPSVNREAFAW